MKVAEKLLQKLPINHDVFTNMALITPTLRQSASPKAFKTLGTRFPAAGVHKNLEEISCEVGPYRFDPVLPEVSYYKAANGVMKLDF